MKRGGGFGLGFFLCSLYVFVWFGGFVYWLTELTRPSALHCTFNPLYLIVFLNDRIFCDRRRFGQLSSDYPGKNFEDCLKFRAIFFWFQSVTCNNFTVTVWNIGAGQAQECSSSVDIVTLLSILPISYVDKHTANVGEANIDSDRNNWAWCTNPKCQRVIHRQGPHLTGRLMIPLLRFSFFFIFFLFSVSYVL